MADIFSVLAAICILASVSVYLFKLFRGETIANPVTWGIAVVAITLNNLTYNVVSQGNLKENVPGLIVNIVVCVIFIQSLIKIGELSLTMSDAATLALAIAIGFVWWRTGDAIRANILLQVALLLSFWPTIIGLTRGDLRDHPLPWLCAVASYVFQVLTIITNRTDWMWSSLAFPVADGILGNGTVAIVAWHSNARLRASSATASS